MTPETLLITGIIIGVLLYAAISYLRTYTVGLLNTARECAHCGGIVDVYTLICSNCGRRKVTHYERQKYFSLFHAVNVVSPTLGNIRPELDDANMERSLEYALDKIREKDKKLARGLEGYIRKHEFSLFREYLHETEEQWG